MSARLKQVRISSMLVASMITEGDHDAYRCVKNCLPWDAQIVRVDLEKNGLIVVTFSSDSFPELTFGESIPILEPMFERITRQ